MARTCVFCGDPNRVVTAEHIFAEWVDRAVDQLFPGAPTTPSLSELVDADRTVRPYVSLPLEQKVRYFCGSCNNGWMSALESKVAPILGPMVAEEKWTNLRLPAQRLIATWAVKTAFVIHYLHPRTRRIPHSQYHRFYVEQQPLKSQMVWLGRRDSLLDHTGRPLVAGSRVQEIGTVDRASHIPEEHIARQVAAGERVYRITFTLGHVVFVVFGHSFSGTIEVGLSPELSRMVVCIWPLRRRTTWPPPDPIDLIGGLDGLHEVFGRPPPTGQ